MKQAIYCLKCEWYLWACKRRKKEFWEITIDNGPHTCTSSSISKYSKMMNSSFIKRQIHQLVKSYSAAKLKILTAHVNGMYEGKIFLMIRYEM